MATAGQGLEIGTSTGEGDLGRIWTVPNVLSLLRLGLLVGFAVLLLSDHEHVESGLLLAAAGVTDFFDGFIARRFQQVSTLGKILDPTIDRLVLVTAIVAIVVVGAVPIWLAAVVLAREAFVGILALTLAGLGARRIEVSFLGKAGTFGLMWCFPLFLGGDGSGSWASFARGLAWVVVVPSLACSVAAVVAYVPRAKGALREGRLERSDAAGIVVKS